MRRLSFPFDCLLAVSVVGCGTHESDKKGANPSSYAGVYTGDYRIWNHSDAVAITNVDEITGHLFVSGGDLTNVALPKLATIGGELYVENTSALTILALTGLTTVGADLSIAKNSMLTNLDLPILATTGGRMSVYGNTALPTFALPSLTTVSGYLEVRAQPSLTSLDLPILTAVGGYLSVYDNAVLTSFDLSSLTTVGGNLNLAANPHLPTCAANNLVAQLGAGVTGTITVSGNDDAGTCP